MSFQTKPDGPGDEGRDPALDRLYAESAREEPPARLDAAILAAARREVRSRPRRLGSLVRAARVPVAIAAVLVLSASLVMLLKEEKADQFYEAPPPAEPQSDARGKVQDDAALPPQASPAPQAAARRAPEVASPPAPAAERRPPRMDEARQARNDGPRPAQTVPPPAAQPFPAPASAGEERGRTPPRAEQSKERLAAAKEAESGLAAAEKAADRPAVRVAPEAPPAKPLPQSDAIAKQRFEADTGTGGSSEQLARSAPAATAQSAPPPPAKAAPRSKLPPAQSASRAPIWSGYERQPPDRWLERIADLRHTGREADAREMAEEFIKRFPDYPLPASRDR